MLTFHLYRPSLVPLSLTSLSTLINTAMGEGKNVIRVKMMTMLMMVGAMKKSLFLSTKQFYPTDTLAISNVISFHIVPTLDIPNLDILDRIIPNLDNFYPLSRIKSFFFTLLSPISLLTTTLHQHKCHRLHQ